MDAEERMTAIYEVHDMFNNGFECSHNVIVVEIVHKWLDEDGEQYYIIKCREIVDQMKNGEGAWHYSHFPWMLVDDVKLVDGFYLYKYFEKE